MSRSALELDDDGAFVDGVFRALLQACVDGSVDSQALECVLRTAVERSRLETRRAAAVLRRALLLALHRYNGAAVVAAARHIMKRDPILECLLEDDVARGPHSAGASYNAAAASAEQASALGAPFPSVVVVRRDGRPWAVLDDPRSRASVEPALSSSISGSSVPSLELSGPSARPSAPACRHSSPPVGLCGWGCLFVERNSPNRACS